MDWGSIYSFFTHLIAFIGGGIFSIGLVLVVVYLALVQKIAKNDKYIQERTSNFWKEDNAVPSSQPTTPRSRPHSIADNSMSRSSDKLKKDPKDETPKQTRSKEKKERKEKEREERSKQKEMEREKKEDREREKKEEREREKKEKEKKEKEKEDREKEREKEKEKEKERKEREKEKENEDFKLKGQIEDPIHRMVREKDPHRRSSGSVHRLSLTELSTSKSSLPTTPNSSPPSGSPPYPPIPPTAGYDVIKMGWVKIRGSLKVWWKRFVVVRPGRLIYYRTEKKEDCFGMVILTGCDVIVRETAKNGFAFRVYSPDGKNIYSNKGLKGESLSSAKMPGENDECIMRVFDEDSRKDWMAAIAMGISMEFHENSTANYESEPEEFVDTSSYDGKTPRTQDEFQVENVQVESFQLEKPGIPISQNSSFDKSTEFPVGDVKETHSPPAVQLESFQLENSAKIQLENSKNQVESLERSNSEPVVSSLVTPLQLENLPVQVENQVEDLGTPKGKGDVIREFKELKKKEKETKKRERILKKDMKRLSGNLTQSIIESGLSTPQPIRKKHLSRQKSASDGEFNMTDPNPSSSSEDEDSEPEEKSEKTLGESKIQVENPKEEIPKEVPFLHAKIVEAEEGKLELRIADKWKEYFFVLRNGLLVYFPSEKSSDCEGLIDLDGCSVRHSGPINFEIFHPLKKSIQFSVNVGREISENSPENSQDPTEDSQIVHGQSTIFLRAESQSVAMQWVAALLNQVDNPSAVRVMFPRKKRAEGREEKCHWFNMVMSRYFMDLKQSQVLKYLVMKIISKKFDRIRRPDYVGPLVIQDLDLGQEIFNVKEIFMVPTEVPNELMGEAEISYKGGASLTVTTEFYVNFPRHHFATIPLKVHIRMTSLEGRLLFYGPSEIWSQFSMCFLQLPKCEFSVNLQAGKYEVGKFQKISDWIVSNLKKILWKNTVAPNRISFALPLPGKKIQVKTEQLTSKRRRHADAPQEEVASPASSHPTEE